MTDGSEFDPIFAKQPVPHSGHAEHEARPSGTQWVVVHRGGAGSKAHVEALERKLIKARIHTRVEHDDEGRVVLEVPREYEAQAIATLGEGNTHGAGETAHASRDSRLEGKERAELHGAFAATQSKWLLVVLAVAVLGLLGFWFLSYWPIFH